MPAQTTPPTSVHDVKALVQSFHPLIVIETVEEERARALVLAAAQELRMPLFEWSITRGLVREGAPKNAMRVTADPAATLPHIGESEKNFLRATALAESMAPAVLWIDEIEKGLVASNTGDADGGLSRRLFGAFLTWLQEKKQEVFLVATANDLSALAPELLRKGRFDEIFFVDLPDLGARRQIWGIHLRRRNQDAKAFDLGVLVDASDGFSGAEIEQAVVAGLYRALHAGSRLLTGQLLDELRETRPLSVTRREDIERLRAIARDRFQSVH